MLSQASLSNFTMPQYNACVSTYVPRPEGLGRGEDIVFGADPVGICGRVGVRVGIREVYFP